MRTRNKGASRDTGARRETLAVQASGAQRFSINARVEERWIAKGDSRAEGRPH